MTTDSLQPAWGWTASPRYVLSWHSGSGTIVQLGQGSPGVFVAQSRIPNGARITDLHTGDTFVVRLQPRKCPPLHVRCDVHAAALQGRLHEEDISVLDGWTRRLPPYLSRARAAVAEHEANLRRAFGERRN